MVWTYLFSHVNIILKFTCSSKCVDYDYNRGIVCRENSCKGCKYIIKPNLNSEDAWLCKLCNNRDIPADSLIFEIEILSTFNSIKCKTLSNFDKMIEEYLELLDLAKIYLSPTHYLISSILLELSNINASIANKLGSNELALQLRLESVLYHLKVLSLLECAEHKCESGINCIKEHHMNAQYGMCYVFWSFMDLIYIKNSKNTNYTISIPFYLKKLQKYKYQLEFEYGSNDPDIIAILSLYDEQYNNSITSNTKCCRKFCFSVGTKQCSKCRNPNVLYCSKECQVSEWQKHKKTECLSKKKK